MVSIKKLVLDILKPHQPDAIDFTQSIAKSGDDYRVRLLLLEMDENTETIQIEVRGRSLDFTAIKTAISDMGGSLHSIDAVEVHSEPESK